MTINLVCLVYSAYPDGIARYFENLAVSLLLTRKVRLILWVPSGLEGFLRDRLLRGLPSDFDFVSLQINGVGNPRFLLFQVRIFFEWRRNYIFTSLTPCFVPSNAVRVIHDITFLKNPISLSKRQVAIKFSLLCLAALNGTPVAISEKTVKDVSSITWIPKLPFRFLVENGLPFYLQSSGKPPIRFLDDLDSGILRIAYVGSANLHKGIDRAIDFVLALSNEGGCHIEFKVVGKIDEYWTAALSQISTSQLRVEVRGFVSDADLEDILRHSSLLLLLSRNEGFGIPIMEALHCGCLPVLSHEVAGNFGIMSSLVFSESMSQSQCAEFAQLWSARLSNSGYHQYIEQLDQVYRSNVHNYDAGAKKLLKHFEGTFSSEHHEIF